MHLSTYDDHGHLHGRFGAWYASLSVAEQDAVLNVVTKLEALGIMLGNPHSSALEGTAHSLRELRPLAGASPLRPIYAFDPRRQAVLLIGGDKADDKRFYKRIVPVAEKIWTQCLAEQKAGLHEEEEPD